MEIEELRQVAKQGIAETQYNLGVCYYNGDGVVTNKAEAVKWFRILVKQGCVAEQYVLNTIAK